MAMIKYPDRERSRMVLIGISDYDQHKSLSRLPAVHNNLTALEAILTDPIRGVFASDHCMVVDTPDSPRSLITRLTRGANEAEDVLFVYYAGHGLLDLAGDLHLTVRETDPEQVAGTAVPYEWVRQIVSNSPASTRILILDCCFSGQAVGIMSSDSAALNQIEVSGTYILASTTANRISVAIPGEKYTAFTGELIKLLSAEAKCPLKLGDLYRPLSAAMARRGFPRPKSSTGDSSGQLALTRPIELCDKSAQASGMLDQLTALDVPADAEVIRAGWEDILAAVKAERKVAWLLLSNATVSDFIAGTLTLTFGRDGEARGFIGSGYSTELCEALEKTLGINPTKIRAASATGATYETGSQRKTNMASHAGTNPTILRIPADAEIIRARWKELLAAVRAQRKVAWLLLSNATVSDFNAGTLTLTFGREGEARGFAGSGYGADLREALQKTFGINPKKICATSPAGASYIV